MTQEPRRYQQFREDMREAGYEVEEYNGRYFYRGPAVRCDDLQDAIRATKVRLQSDQMGKHGYIVYPA